MVVAFIYTFTVELPTLIDDTFKVVVPLIITLALKVTLPLNV